MDDTFYLVLSSHDRACDIVIPRGESDDAPWEIVVDTKTGKIPVGTRTRTGETLTLAPRSLVLLRQRRD
jgi:hypothetical protein